jgi:hypothetical protein
MTFIKRNLIVGSISLVLNALWEYAVCAYFYDNEIVSNMWKLMIEATIGDMFVTVILFNIVIMFKKDKKWLFKPYDYFNLSIYGVASAFYFESKALRISRWAYSDAMPLFGQSAIGLLPVLQFAILIPLSVFLGMLIQNKISKSYS